MRLFLKFFGLHQRVPLHLFQYFATQWMSKNCKGPPFTFFGTVTLFKNLIKKIFWEIFSCLQRVPPSFFLNFLQPAGVSQSPKGPPFKFWALDMAPTLAVLGLFLYRRERRWRNWTHWSEYCWVVRSFSQLPELQTFCRRVRNKTINSGEHLLSKTIGVRKFDVIMSIIQIRNFPSTRKQNLEAISLLR